MAELRTIDPDDDGARLDRWFKRHYPNVTHVLLEKLLRKGEVRLDGKRAKAADRVAAGQSLRLPPQVIHAKEMRAEKPQAEPKNLRNFPAYANSPFLVTRGRPGRSWPENPIITG